MSKFSTSQLEQHIQASGEHTSCPRFWLNAICLLALFSTLWSTSFAQVDTDGDGIFDSIDIDDDNDGILDVDECTVESITYEVDAVAQHFSTNEIPFLFDGDSGYSNNQDFRIHQSDSPGENVITFSFSHLLPTGSQFTLHYVNDDISGANSGAIQSFVGALINEGYDHTFWDYDNDGSLTTSDFDINNDGDFDLGSDYSPLGVTISFYNGDPGAPAGSGIGTLVHSEFSPIQIIDLVSYSHTITSPQAYDYICIESNPDGTGKDPRLVEVEFNSNSNSGDLEISIQTDTDGDGNANCLDTDSDGDGCPDAMEANGSITFDDLTGTGAIGGSVDDDGVPDLVSGGQTDETSTDDTVSNIICFNLLLPVELIDFAGEQVGTKNVLDWQTTSEVNCSHFEIYRSTDGLDYDILGTIAGAGNSQALVDYTFVDHNPKIGLNYYRLRQVDFDGVAEFSDLISIDYELDAFDISVYPNPIKLGEKNSIIRLSGMERGMRLNIGVHDISGKKIYYIGDHPDESIQTFDIPNRIFEQLGAHLVIIDCDDKRITRRVLVID